MSQPHVLPSQEQFYEQNEARRHSHVLSYGSGWQYPSWTDAEHVIEVFWLGETHELAAYFITYDWDRLAPGKLTRDVVGAEVLNISVDSGLGVGRALGDLDLATSAVNVDLLGVVHSDLECHEVMWGWHWWQHHPDGLEHYRQRVRDHAAS